MSALPPLMKAMNQENVVALVRRVYQKNGAPKLGLLIPEENSKNGQVNNLKYRISSYKTRGY